MKFFTLFLLFITILENFAQDEDLLVDTGDFGRIRGRFGSTFRGRQIVEFLSIPYAQPPLGELRFMPSVRLDRVTEDGEVFNATIMGPKCTQPGLDTAGTSEDCLAISIYTPQIKKSESQELYPIFVWIHGGTFITGTGNDFNGYRLLDKNVILVSVNYRNSIPGYFSLGIPEAPGNGAIHDVLNVLRWIQDYIEFFGGDKNRVNIAGQSSGSAIVTHVLLSHMAKGLIHGVIGQSGSALDEWATVRDGSIHGGLRIAKFCGCTLMANSTDLPAIARCMKTIPPIVMNLNAARYFLQEQMQGRLGFEQVNPWVEMPPNPNAVVSDNPVNILEQGKQNRVNFMGGATRHDGSGILNDLYNMYLLPNGYVNDEEFLKWEIVPAIMRALRIENKHGYHQMVENEFLLKTKLSGNFSQMIPELTDIANAFFFKSGVFRLAQMHSRFVKNTFFYSFDYNWRMSNSGQQNQNEYSPGFLQLDEVLGLDPITKVEIPEGVGHSAELEYLFHRRQLSTEDQRISDQLVTYWTNFCIFGNPNGNETSGEYPDWPRFSEKNPQFIFIDKVTRIEENYPKLWPGVSYELAPGYEMPDEGTTTNAEETTKSDEVSETTKLNEVTECPQLPEEKDNKENLFRALFIVFLTLFILTLIGSGFFVRKIKRGKFV